MKQTVFFLLLTLVFSCNVKQDFEYPLVVENNSGESLLFYAATEGSLLMYNDTLLTPSRDDIDMQIVEESVRIGNPIRWVERISYLPLDTLSIYFFHPETLAAYDWNQIRNDYKVLKRYDLSIDDLTSLNFTVPYPPTAEMEGVKQYP
jgi:hypothetical protein